MAERRYTTVFYAAILTGLVATYGVYRYLQQAKAASQVQMQSVVIAARDVPEGEKLDRLALSLAQWPMGTAPESAFTNIDSVVGRVVRIPVFKGEAVVPGRLAPAGTGPGLEVKISAGMRAMAVKINDVAGLSGLIQPNNRVDVLVTLKANPQQNTKEEAKLFMSNMRVLSVGTQVERGDDGKPIQATTATLEVTPQQAEQLAVAMNEGTIQLVLRGFGDPDSIKTPGATAADVLAQLRTGAVRVAEQDPPKHTRVRARPQPVAAPPVRMAADPPPRPDSIVVRVYRGDKLTQQKFDQKDSVQH
ncbi:MAG TPA: Flp pilus assembly protein CpaB [Gemmatimonadaceae bacterium]|nr:Flp pilus assembly protein CpaB [Gemmatimonadaceae bacterium]